MATRGEEAADKVYRMIGFPDPTVYGPDAVLRTGVFRILAGGNAVVRDLLHAIGEAVPFGDGYGELWSEAVDDFGMNLPLDRVGLRAGDELRAAGPPQMLLRLEAVDRVPTDVGRLAVADRTFFDVGAMEEIDPRACLPLGIWDGPTDSPHRILLFGGTRRGDVCYDTVPVFRQLRTPGVPTLGCLLYVASRFVGCRWTALRFRDDPRPAGRLDVPVRGDRPACVFALDAVDDWGHLRVDAVCDPIRTCCPPYRRAVPVRQLYFSFLSDGGRDPDLFAAVSVLADADYLGLKG